MNILKISRHHGLLCGNIHGEWCKITVNSKS